MIGSVVGVISNLRGYFTEEGAENQLNAKVIGPDSRSTALTEAAKRFAGPSPPVTPTGSQGLGEIVSLPAAPATEGTLSQSQVQAPAVSKQIKKESSQQQNQQNQKPRELRRKVSYQNFKKTQSFNNALNDRPATTPSNSSESTAPSHPALREKRHSSVAVLGPRKIPLDWAKAKDRALPQWKSESNLLAPPAAKKKVKKVETNEDRLRQRAKQIEIGKSTVEYQRYVKDVQVDKRGREDPRTPDIHRVCSKRCFDGQLRKWRRDLHKWDPEDAVKLDDATVDKEEVDDDSEDDTEENNITTST
eukprot:GFYU01000833.1.p1 GENE.GFYU01000833.1~~GFYU01000833.1.p1  ORF type:complete len:304 (+),score=90.50 GFYU01000833.1:336-1247(+)